MVSKIMREKVLHWINKGERISSWAIQVLWWLSVAYIVISGVVFILGGSFGTWDGMLIACCLSLASSFSMDMTAAERSVVVLTKRVRYLEDALINQGKGGTKK